jgi:anti-sigma B factor antagonist
MRPEDRQSTIRPLVVPLLVTFPREIDINNAPRVCHELIRALDEDVTVLIGDMSLTEFCDSSGIRHLLIADQAARVRRVGLRLVVQSRAVLKVMQTLGVDEVLTIYGSMTAALSGSPTP